MHINPLITMAVALFAFCFAFFAICKAIYHSWFVVTGIRPAMHTKASLLGPFALFMPSLFEEKAQIHLRRLGLWLPVAIAALVTAFTIQVIMGQA